MRAYFARGVAGSTKLFTNSIGCLVDEVHGPVDVVSMVGAEPIKFSTHL
jgi:hypothetical protein